MPPNTLSIPDYERLVRHAERQAPGAGRDLVHDAVTAMLAANPPPTHPMAWIMRRIKWRAIDRGRLRDRAQDAYEQLGFLARDTCVDPADQIDAARACAAAPRELVLLAMGYSHKDVAERCGMTVGTSTSMTRARRMRKKLKASL